LKKSRSWDAREATMFDGWDEEIEMVGKTEKYPGK
jgi:hypothetical protein